MLSCENLTPLNNYIVLSSFHRADDKNIHEIRRYIHLADLMRFMREDEAVKAMGLFEGASESNRVNKTALKDWVVMIFSFFWKEAMNFVLNLHFAVHGTNDSIQTQNNI